MATKKTANKRTSKKTVPAPVVKKDPVDEALKDTVCLYFRQDIAPKMLHEAKKVAAAWVGRTHVSVKPTAYGVEIHLSQKLGFGREVSGSLELMTEFYGRDLAKAVKDGVKTSRTKHMDQGFYIGEPIVNAMEVKTAVSFSCGGRTATEALGQAEQIRVMAHALLALEVYLNNLIDHRDIGDAILSHMKLASKLRASAAKTEDKPVEPAAAV